MNLRVRLILLLMVGLTLAVRALPAYSLNYGEHAYVTYAAGTNFCDRYQNQKDVNRSAGDLANYLCQKIDGKRPRLICFAHFVAIAGDYVAVPKNLLVDGRVAPLKSGVIDCSTLTEPERAFLSGERPCPRSRKLTIDTSVNVPELSCQLVDRVGPGTLLKSLFGAPGAFQEQFAYVRLVSGNQQHFPPWSISVWNEDEEYLEGKCLNDLYVATEADRPSRRIVQSAANDAATRLAHAAFLFHYLEDSLPAGHMGSRRDKCHHDYDNAHHDDYNAYGRFIRIIAREPRSEKQASREEQLRYVYGDGGLFKDTVYVNEEALRSEAEIAAFVAQNSKYEWRDIRHWKAAISSGPQHGVQRVLSVPYSGDNVGRSVKCALWDSCRKESLVLASAETWAQVVQRCVDPNESVSNVVVCRHETLRVFQTAIEEAFGDMFSSVREMSSSSASLQDVLPASFLSVVPENPNNGNVVSSGSRSNAELLVVDFADPMRYSSEASGQADGAPIEPFTDIGFAVRSDVIEGSAPRRSALTFSLKVSGLPGIEDAKGFARTSDKVAVDLRFDLLDTRGKFLNRSSLGVLFPDALNNVLFNQRVIGITPTGSIGYANLWDGGGSRNVFGSIGLSFDIHVARHAFYAEVLQERHYNSRQGWWWGTGVFVGYRTLAISLDRRH